MNIHAFRVYNLPKTHPFTISMHFHPTAPVSSPGNRRSVHHFDALPSHRSFSPMTEIPGIAARHAIITPDCRTVPRPHLDADPAMAAF